MKRRGRKPAGLFPIRRTVVVHGREYQKNIDELDRLRCRLCQKQFRVSRDNVFLYEGEDDMPQIQCPTCGYSCAVLYYFS